MGTIVAVDSVVYNMAGEEENRPQYLQSLVVRNVLADTRDSMGDTLKNGYLNGPGIKLRNFYRWASNPDNYGEIGLPTGELEIHGVLDPTLVTGAIPHPPEETVWVQTADVGYANPIYWAEQWILENRVDDINDNWTVDYSENTGAITIKFSDDTTETLIPGDYDPAGRYVYAYYILVLEDQAGPLVTGATVVLSSAGSFPSTIGWGLSSDATTPFSGDLHTVTTEHTHIRKSYSDGRPDEITESDQLIDDIVTPYAYEDFSRIYERRTNIIDNGDDSFSFTLETMYQDQDGSVITNHSESEPTITEEVTEEGGVTVTTTTTKTTLTDADEIILDRSYRIDTQDNLYRDYSPTRMLIYKIGSGNAELDNLVSTAADYGEFFPFLPIRLDNKFLSETYLSSAYEQVKRGYKKATGGRLSKLVEELKDNDSLGDIDHAYVVFGVSLNVIENSCKKYLYKFFQKLIDTQAGGSNTYSQWQDDYAQYREDLAEWERWYGDPDGTISTGGGENSQYEQEPPRPRLPKMPKNRIKIKGTGEINSRFNTHLEWLYIDERSGTGLGKTGAKKGDLWFEYIGTGSYGYSVKIKTSRGEGEYEYYERPILFEKIRLYNQIEDNNFTYLEIVGATYYNYVYGGKAVTITAKQALDDPEESGFIVPLHYDTWREISLIDSTQMATACVFIVFNCYEIHKTKWYESGIFRILLVIVIAIASVVLTGGAGIGILGTHLSVGTALGFSGMTAAIVGSVANALAAMVLATLLEQVLGGLGIIGDIISALLMIAIGSAASAFRNTGSWAINWGDMLRVDNLIKLTNAVGNSIADSMRIDALQLTQDWLDYSKQAGRESREIQQAYFKEFGYGSAQIDPLMFVDSGTTILAESSDTFLTRTLMTGSDIANMSQELLYNFTEYSLTLPDAFS